MRFGSSGIRGAVGREITPELALRLGRAVGTLHRRILVARDTRTSGPMLSQALAAGALSSGATVADAGVVPTPSLAFGTSGYDAGVMVTASHNPATDNGFKVWLPGGRAADAARRHEIETLLPSPAGSVPWMRVGQLHLDPSCHERHLGALVDRVRPARHVKVVVDCANGAAHAFTPELLRRMGCEVVALNAQPDGAFPGREPEPLPEHLSDLRKAVVATGAACGVAHDGDADRAVAVTERGDVVPGDALLALLARRSGARSVVVPVDTSLAVDDALPGATIHRTRVGDAFVSEEMTRTGSGFGGEPSGAYIFPEISLCPDGPHAAALVSAIASEGSLAQAVAELPSHPVHRISIRAPRERIAAALPTLAAELSTWGTTSTVDGVRVETKDGWVLVRESGTEPKVRITSEARSDEAARAQLDRAATLVRRILGA
ncbi:MAG TPA: phosphoglucosamine mutase [Candidatus Thermoplasmatota archaeon]|nr:phosphoglucosamine mutase [Candidatus Thermoplasmatota archaeon]